MYVRVIPVHDRCAYTVRRSALTNRFQVRRILGVLYLPCRISVHDIHICTCIHTYFYAFIGKMHIRRCAYACVFVCVHMNSSVHV